MPGTQARLSLVAVMGTVLLAAACGQNAGETSDKEASADQTAQVPVGAPAAVAAPTDGSNLWAGGRSVPLNIQVAHPNGVVLQLTSLQSRPTETAVGIRVLNGRDREVHLNRFNNRRDGYIVVDTGERIYLSPPAGNADLALPAGQTLEGELVFLGRLPEARTAILILNENSSTDNQNSTTPGFSINLPLDQLTSGAASETAALTTAQPASPAQ